MEHFSKFLFPLFLFLFAVCVRVCVLDRFRDVFRQGLNVTQTMVCSPKAYTNIETALAVYWRQMGLTVSEVDTTCNTLQSTATYSSTLLHNATRCKTVQCTATHCNTLQHTATHCNTLQHTATHCNTLQHTATYSSTLHHNATRCKTVQCTATFLHTPLSEQSCQCFGCKWGWRSLR